MLAIVVALIGMWILPASEGVIIGPTRSDCQRSCGDLTIPYPFGIQGQQGCYFDDGASPMSSFIVSCEQVDGRQSMFIYNSTYKLEMLDISVENHEIRALAFVATDCYSSSGARDARNTPWLRLPRFPISSTRNMFTAVGCDTLAIFGGQIDQNYVTGCVAYCENITGITNGTCSGLGCCQSSNIPKNATNYQISIASFYNHSRVKSFNPCSYAFIVETGYFNFSTQYLYNMTETRMPMIFDWSIGNQTCDEARNDMTSYMCTDNTDCTDDENRSGYRCHCMEGYQGNPYIPHGCQDINECETLRPCNTTCTNLAGTYNCTCPSGYIGDGRKDGTGCSPIQRPKKFTPTAAALAIGAAVGAFLLLLVAMWLCRAIKRRKQLRLKKKFFKQNGGLLLQQQLSSPEGNIEKGKLFNSKEIEKATDNFNRDRILGQGGQGTVYKGMLRDGRIVAIKKSKVMDKENIDQFINEVFILSQINHRNVVKLLGYCLETVVPLLVYEFIPNGTLYHYLHNPNDEFPVPWDTRLRLAVEVAGALAYLHSASSIPIYHRDIKTANILLDDKYRAKIADFGTSRSVALDQTHVTTLVQGTFGYLDPEYFQSSQFTDKSDVYSFGVVLVELLTRQKPVSSLRANEGRSLASNFILSVEENRLLDIIDAQVLNQGKQEEIIAVANLARRCLHLDGKNRPTMKEVAVELEGVAKKPQQHPSLSY